MHPNFPANLAISPSHQDSSSGYPGISFSAQQDAIEKYGIAGRVWEAAYAMDFYVQSPADVDFDPPFTLAPELPMTVLELGSGTGMVASRIADKFHNPGRDLIIVTDLPDVCPLLKANLGGQENLGILVRPLAWGNSEHALRLASELFPGNDFHPRFLTHIVCSDLIYFPDLLAPLLRTLIELSSIPFIPPPDRTSPEHELLVFISYKVRSLVKEAPFWSAFGLWFTFEPVLTKPKPLDGRHSDGASWTRLGSRDGPTFVFVARRRPSSFTWRVPESDQELMGGVGAWGTDGRKGDDAFETLLLMTISSDDDETKDES